jgi:hypothetical protein
MAHPNPDDGLMPDITELYRKDLAQFERSALASTRKHACGLGTDASATTGPDELSGTRGVTSSPLAAATSSSSSSSSSSMPEGCSNSLVGVTGEHVKTVGETLVENGSDVSSEQQEAEYEEDEYEDEYHDEDEDENEYVEPEDETTDVNEEPSKRRRLDGQAGSEEP